MNSSRRAPGRPPLAEVSDLRARALDVVLRHGYAGVTLGRIAAETGVSLRTLHRYFPAKADIVWGEVDGAFDALRQGFENTTDDMPLIEAIIAAVVTAFDLSDDELELNRARIRLIVTTPELQAVQSDMFSLWHGQLVEVIARRMEETPEALLPRAAASAVQAVIMEALAFWAAQDSSEPPAAVVARALRSLQFISSPDVPR